MLRDNRAVRLPCDDQAKQIFACLEDQIWLAGLSDRITLCAGGAG